MGLLFGSIAHPVLGIDAFSQGNGQLVHQFLHAGLAALGEVAFHINFSYGFAKDLVNRAHGTLPSGAVLL